MRVPLPSSPQARLRVLAYLSACFLLLHLFAQRQSAEVARWCCWTGRDGTQRWRDFQDFGDCSGFQRRAEGPLEVEASS